MRPLSTVQHPAAYCGGVRFFLSLLIVLAGVPGWTGSERLPLIARDVRVTVRPHVPPGGWPRRIGALVPVGAMTLAGDDPAFGSWSAMAIRGGRITLLGDGGNYVRFALRGGEARDVRAGFLRDGPGTGWKKQDRDAESLALDPATGAAWVGYERANAIWRYDATLARAERWARPPAMRRWRENGGAESLVRLADGRFVVIAEKAAAGAKGRGLRPMLLFDRDPTDPRARLRPLYYRPPAGFDPSDAAQLPGGDIVILNRAWRFPLRFAARLVRVPLAALRGEGVVAGREIARLEPPLLDENAEAIAVTREGGATMLWIATDNDSHWFRPGYLYKFRLLP